MARDNIVLFVVEGVKREVAIFDAVMSFFFPNRKFSYAILPAGSNIYMLYQKLKADDFETDIVEVIKESGASTLGDVGEKNAIRCPKSISSLISMGKRKTCLVNCLGKWS